MEVRKIKPYPEVAPDNLDDLDVTEEELQAWAGHMALAILLALFVIFLLLAGMAGYMWGMLQ